MNFERGKDPKESLQIGKLWKAIRAEFIGLNIIDRSIPDNRTAAERRIYPNPQTIRRKRLKGEEAHKMFLMMQKKDTFWTFIYELFPDHSDLMKAGKLALNFYIILEREAEPYHASVGGHSFLTLNKCFGKDFYYDGKIYSIPLNPL